MKASTIILSTALGGVQCASVTDTPDLRGAAIGIASTEVEPGSKNILMLEGRLTEAGSVIAVLGDGGKLCGPFKMEIVGYLGPPILEIKAGECIEGAYPDWKFPERMQVPSMIDEHK